MTDLSYDPIALVEIRETYERLTGENFNFKMNILEFPLAWRWTQTSHAVFSEEMLNSMRPLLPTEAANIQNLVRSYQSSRDRLNKVTCESISIDTSKVTRDEIAKWLKQNVGNEVSPVIVSWSNDLALEALWQIFNEHWDDFCYPSSDDVVIWPNSGKWALQYFHHEQFTFWLRTAA